TMSKEQKTEEQQQSRAPSQNVATTYGLEEHEANQEDPRVSNLRRADSVHLSKSVALLSTSKRNTDRRISSVVEPTSLQQTSPKVKSVEPTAPVAAAAPEAPSPTPEPPSPTPEPAQEQAPAPAPVPVNVAADEGPEERKRKSSKAFKERTSRLLPPPTVPVQKVKIEKPPKVDRPVPPCLERIPVVPIQPPLPQPAAAYNIKVFPNSRGFTEARGNRDQNKDHTQSNTSKMGGVDQSNNTDVSFPPNKMFATKTTNTSGSLYDDVPMPVPIPVPPPTREPTQEQKSSGPKPLPPGPFDLDDCYEFAVYLVRKAGVFALASNRAKQRLPYVTKEHEHDLNTTTDNEVEQMLVTAILDRYPSHKIIAEEEVSRSQTGQVTLTDEHTWIIDPIDGTMNFVHHFPYYCISVAFYMDKEAKFGIVYNPPQDEMYTARKDSGAYLNDKKLRTSGQDSLASAMVLQEYSSGMDDRRTAVAMDNANRLIKRTHALRSIGSSAMGLALVAAGLADAFYFFGLHVWDMAAGNLLVTEAGGTVIDPAGVDVDIMSRRVLAAATETLAYQLSTELSQNYPKPRDDEPRNQEEPKDESNKRDFNAQTEFTDSSVSLTSSERSIHRSSKPNG
ncbi:hypothetical protein KR222_000318, partial [Zaprionus bogoriensis]